jgi:Transposase IS116/IS110/IS902 family
MAYLGMVPSEHSSGPKRRVGAITKAGDVHARTLLIEAAHASLTSLGTSWVPSTPCRKRARHCLEGADPVVPALSAHDGKGQAEAGCGHRDRTRVGRVRLVHCLHHLGSAGKELCSDDCIGRGLPNCGSRPRAASPAAEG